VALPLLAVVEFAGGAEVGVRARDAAQLLRLLDGPLLLPLLRPHPQKGLFHAKGHLPHRADVLGRPEMVVIFLRDKSLPNDANRDEDIQYFAFFEHRSNIGLHGEQTISPCFCVYVPPCFNFSLNYGNYQQTTA